LIRDLAAKGSGLGANYHDTGARGDAEELAVHLIPEGKRPVKTFIDMLMKE
jgi:hypothetical protein